MEKSHVNIDVQTLTLCLDSKMISFKVITLKKKALEKSSFHASCFCRGQIDQRVPSPSVFFFIKLMLHIYVIRVLC